MNHPCIRSLDADSSDSSYIDKSSTGYLPSAPPHQKENLAAPTRRHTSTRAFLPHPCSFPPNVGHPTVCEDTRRCATKARRLPAPRAGNGHDGRLRDRGGRALGERSTAPVHRVREGSWIFLDLIPLVGGEVIPENEKSTSQPRTLLHKCVVFPHDPLGDCSPQKTRSCWAIPLVGHMRHSTAKRYPRSCSILLVSLMIDSLDHSWVGERGSEIIRNPKNSLLKLYTSTARSAR